MIKVSSHTYSNGTLTISDANVRTIKAQLPYIDEGVSRAVYDLGDCVLKVDLSRGGSFAGGCNTESAAWDRIVGTTYEEFFAPVLASGNGWLVMAKVTGTVGWGNVDAKVQATIDAAGYAGIRDLHAQNLGWMPDGRCVVIDYAFQLNSDENGYWNNCECGDHDCEDCYPDGCDCCCSLHDWEGCQTFDGCKATACEGTDCQHNADQTFQTEGFGFVPGNVYNVCQDCHDRLAGKPAPVVQCAGQGRLVEGWDGAGRQCFVFDAVTQHRLFVAEQNAARAADEAQAVAIWDAAQRKGSARFVQWMRQGGFTFDGNNWTGKAS